MSCLPKTIKWLGLKVGLNKIMLNLQKWFPGPGNHRPMKAAISPGLMPIWKQANVFMSLIKTMFMGLRSETHNDVVQVEVQQVWKCLLHHLLLWHPFEAVYFPPHLLEGLIYLLLFPISLRPTGLLGFGTRFGFGCVWVFGGLWCPRDFLWFGDFRWFGLPWFLGLSGSPSLFGWTYETRGRSDREKEAELLCTFNALKTFTREKQRF